MTTKPYRYKIPRSARVRGALNRPKPAVERETLTGTVKGLPASDIEERFAIALYKNNRVNGFEFREPFVAGRSLPGEIELDFLIFAGGMYPVQIDGEYAHKTAEQKAADAAKDAVLDGILSGTGALPTERIPGDLLETQDEADRLVSEMF